MTPFFRSLPLLSMAMALALCGPQTAHAGNSVELRVTGIIKPGACTPVLSGHVDYGIIANDWGDLDVKSGDAGAASPTLLMAQANPANPARHARVLPTRSVSLSISCTAAIPVAILVRDNKRASKVDGLVHKAPSGATEDSMFSLDATRDSKHGAFHLAMRSTTAGGEAVDMISSPLDKAEWQENPAGAMNIGRLLSWAKAGTLQPGAWSTISGTLEVTPILSGQIDRSQDIKLNGSATIEIRYL